MIPACILAGGEARRLGGKGKALIKVSSKTLLDLVLEKLHEQVSLISINTRDKNVILNKKYVHIEDTFKDVGGAGPLAGVLSAIIWAKKVCPKSKYVLTVPVDCPFIPHDLVKNLYVATQDHRYDVIVASSNYNIHPVIAIWSVDLLNSLDLALRSGIRKIDMFTNSYDVKTINWDIKNIDPFFNINRPEDLIIANTFINS